MNAMTLPKTAAQSSPPARSKIRKSFRELTRNYFAKERNWEFVIEAVAFAIILAISIWPMVLAAGALHNYLHCAVG